MRILIAILLLHLFAGPAAMGQSGVKVVNMGAAGLELEKIRTDLAPKAVGQKPSLIIFSGGLNDTVNPNMLKSRAELRKEFSGIFSELKKAECPVIALTIPLVHEHGMIKQVDPALYGGISPSNRIIEANSYIVKLGAEQGVEVVDVNAASANSADFLQRRFALPSIAGHEAIAAALQSVISKKKFSTEKIVCVGDEITYGAGVNRPGTVMGGAYPAALRRFLTPGLTSSVVGSTAGAVASANTKRKGSSGSSGSTGGSAARETLKAGGSVFWPNYLGEGTVYTRGVANMPLAENSAEIAKYMKEMPGKYNNKGVITSVNATFFNLPIYVVDSSDPETPRPKVYFSGIDSRRPYGKMNEILYPEDGVPMPSYAKAANPQRSGDSAMAIYDINTGIIREYFLILKDEEGNWGGNYGGWSQDMFDLANKNYAMQHIEGTDFVVGMIGGLAQVGIEEARRGQVNHAICFTAANARRGVTSWPAKGNDGTDDNPNAPAQGQWFRLPPDLDIDSLNLSPFTKLLAETVQKWGGFASDKNVFCHAFNCEPGFQEEARTGQDPWREGGDLFKKYKGRLGVINDFPWELTEWAPVDWGKPGTEYDYRKTQQQAE